MSSNCPYCGTQKVSKTFNFNEYTCEMCESDFKLTESGIRIFREGSWSSLCLSSLQEMANKVSGANVTDLLSRTLRAASKKSANEIDIVIESLTSIAATLHSEWKSGFRSVNDFTIVMEGIKTFEKAAFALKKRERELNLKIRISEEWSMGEDAIDGVNVDPADVTGAKKSSLNQPKGIPHAMGNVPMRGDIEEAETGSDAEVTGDIDSETGDSGLTDMLKADGTDVPEVDDMGADDSASDLDVGAQSSQEELIANVEDAAETVEDKISRISDKIGELKSALDALKAGGNDTEAPIEEPVMPEEPAAEEVPAEEPVAPEEPVADAPVEDPAAETSDEELDDVLNSSYQRMGKHIYESILGESKKPTTKKSREIGIRTVRADTAGSYRRKIDSTQARNAASDGSDIQTDMTAQENEEEIPFTQQPKKAMEDIKQTANTGKTGMPKIATVEPGVVKRLGTSPGNKRPQNDDFVKDIMNPTKGKTDVKDENQVAIPPNGEESMDEARKGFNGFREGDEVILEKSNDTWKIAEIDKQLFTLVRGKTATVVDTFQEPVRHTDARLEWQRTNELIGETAKRWKNVETEYTTIKENCVGGMCGLGGNRLGASRGGNMPLAQMTAINMSNIPSTKSSKESIYKFIKNNDLHRCQREVAVPRLSEMFTNAIEEMDQILDDAILSESEGQTDQIDSMYDYKSAPIGESAKKSAFAMGWQAIAEKEEKPTPSKVDPAKIQVYESTEDNIINRLGRTAAERLLGE